MKAYLAYISSLILFGTIGLFVRFIDLSSSEIALFRGIIGTSCLLPIILYKTGTKSFFSGMKKNGKTLVISGLLLAGNWIFLFEAYRSTTIAVAALLYYTAPIFMLLFSTLILGERITVKKVCSISVTIIGMILLSNISSTENIHALGVVFSILGAICYAGLMVVNKLIKDMHSIDTTASQLALASIILIPYTLYSNRCSLTCVTGRSLSLLLILGFFHTGIGFLLLFYGIKNIKVHEIAILGYIDPIVSIVLSLVVFKEHLVGLQIVGAFLICLAVLSGTLRLSTKFKKKDT